MRTDINVQDELTRTVSAGGQIHPVVKSMCDITGAAFYTLNRLLLMSDQIDRMHDDIRAIRSVVESGAGAPAVESIDRFDVATTDLISVTIYYPATPGVSR